MYGVEWHGDDLYYSMCIDGQSPARGGKRTFKGVFNKPICPPKSSDNPNESSEVMSSSSPISRQTPERHDNSIKMSEPRLEQPLLTSSFPFEVPEMVVTRVMGHLGEGVFVDGEKDYYENLLQIDFNIQQKNCGFQDSLPLRIPSPPLIRPVRSRDVHAETSDQDEAVDSGCEQKEESIEKWLEPGEEESRITMVMDPSVGDVDIPSLIRKFALFLNVDVPKCYYTQKSPSTESITRHKPGKGEYEQAIQLSGLVRDNIPVCSLCRRPLSSVSLRSVPTWLTQCDEFGLFDDHIDFCSLQCYAKMCKSNNMPVNFDELYEFDRSVDSKKRKAFDTSMYGSKVASRGKDVQWKRYSPPALYKSVNKSAAAYKESYCVIKSDQVEDSRCCVLCGRVGDLSPNGGGRLLYYRVEEWVHINCALWSNQVYETTCGALIHVAEAVKRTRRQICSGCGLHGASLICFRPRCSNVYHVECAKSLDCLFCPSKSFYCPQHNTDSIEDPLLDISVTRRVYVPVPSNYDVSGHINILSKCPSDHQLRIGSLVIVSFGELYPQHILSENFNSIDFIYPSGYEAIRYCICPWNRDMRSKLVFQITEEDGKPFFTVQDRTDPQNIICFRNKDIKLLQSSIYGSEQPPLYDPANDYFPPCLESVFGLTNHNVRLVIESFPGVSSLSKYKFRHGRSHVSSVPLLYNSSGCARTEGVDLNYLRRSKRQPKSEGVVSEDDKSSVRTTQSKQYQYRRMLVEGRNDNVYLGRSSIQGLGLFAAHDIEKGTVLVEYIGEIIRNEVANRREQIYELNNRGVYMFRISDDNVIDASCCGGLARYANHSCTPNCTTEVILFEGAPKILVIAKQRINRGDEVTYDYMFNDVLNLIPCLCMTPNCRKWIC